MNGPEVVTSGDVAELAHNSRAPQRHETTSATSSFGAQLASFYPYMQAPIDPQPRAAAATGPRERATVAEAASLRRRRHGRDD